MSRLPITLKITALFLSLLCTGMTGKAFPALPETGLLWKNVSVADKRMSVYCIFTDSRGIVWLGTNNGLFFYDGVTTHAASNPGADANQIYTIVEKDGRLFLGTDYGLLTFSFQDNSIRHYTEDSPKEIRCMLMSDGQLWLGSIYGMYVIDLDTGKMQDVSEGLPHKSVYSILKDSRGILYAGTYDGLARWEQAEGFFRALDIPVLEENSGNLFVNCLLEMSDRKNISIGTEGNMYLYSPETGSCRTEPRMTGRNIKCLDESDEGHLLVGTDSGIFDLSENTVKQYVHDSRLAQTISNNEIWCIHTEGSNIFAGHELGFSVASEDNAIRTIKLSAITGSGEGNDIHSIYRDSKGRLWLCGTNGVIKFEDGNAAKWYHPSENARSLSHSHIRIIKEDSVGNIWFGTDGGVNRYNEERDDFDVFHIVDKNGKYSSNWVYAIEEDNDRLIVGSYLGGIHSVPESDFVSGGGVIISEESSNTGSPVFKGHNLNLGNDLIKSIIRDRSGNIWILCFNDSFLTKVSPGGETDRYDITALAGSQPASLILDGEGDMWCALNGGAVVFRPDGSCQVIRFPNTDSDESVLCAAEAGNGVWISTVSNIWEINSQTLKVRLLPIPQKSYKSIFSDPATGKVYLGGNDEIAEITPQEISGSEGQSAIRMVLANTGNGTTGIADLFPAQEGLNIPYGGSLTAIVSTLDYSPAAPQRYAYKLTDSEEDSDDRWIIMPENFNTISLPEMKMGDYSLLVRPAGTPGPSYSLPLHVQAPWFLSWPAFLLYFLVLIFIICYIIAYMHRKHIRLAQEEDRRKTLENTERKLAFLSGISHDLKTPLSMIIGPVSILREKVTDGEMRKSLDTVYNNAVRLNGLIHRTLELNYLEDAGENSLILSTFDAVDLCRSIFEAFKENNPQKKFIFHTSEQQLPIEADAVKFESVITNIVSNACKYSENDATISCEICRIDKNIHIIVSDDGIGIDEIDQPLVFQRMFRSPASADKREGTGIGLYLAKRYIELMKGKIELYSAKGQGTSFIITLPLSENAAASHEHPDISDTCHDKPKILIVEDNRQISEFLYDLLKDDWLCLTAENGRAGLSLATSFIPDLIISDELMPLMTGTEMIRRIRQDPRLADIPIIMLTAKSDNGTENESIKSGADIFMQKPFEPSVLRSRIRHLLEMRDKIHKSARIEAITEAKPIEAVSVPEKQLALISKVIEENIFDPDMNVNFLCEKCGMQNKQLYRIIKKYLGVGPLDHIRNVRLQKAAMLLGQKRFTVSEICYMTGFKSPSYFAKCFQEKFGVKPSQYKSDDKIDI